MSTKTSETLPPLTPRQKEIYLWLRDWIEDNDNMFSPSLEEIAARFDMGISAAWQIVNKLVDKGYLIKDEAVMHRGIKLPSRGVCHSCHRPL